MTWPLIVIRWDHKLLNSINFSWDRMPCRNHNRQETTEIQTKNDPGSEENKVNMVKIASENLA